MHTRAPAHTRAHTHTQHNPNTHSHLGVNNTHTYNNNQEREKKREEGRWTHVEGDEGSAMVNGGSYEGCRWNARVTAEKIGESRTAREAGGTRQRGWRCSSLWGVCGLKWGEVARGVWALRSKGLWLDGSDERGSSEGCAWAAGRWSGLSWVGEWEIGGVWPGGVRPQKRWVCM